MPHALLLDFGGVVLRTPFELIDAFLHRRGLAPDLLPWRGPFDLGGDPLFAQVIDGSLTEREYWRIRDGEVAALAGAPDEYPALHQVFEAQEDELIRPEVRDLINDRMAEGHPVAILTNDLTHFHPQSWVDRISILHGVDHLIDLSHTDHLKPDPRAFRLAAATLGLAPGEILFVDDQPVNLAGAVEVGKPHVHFDVTDVAGSVSAIRAALGEK